MGIKWAGAIYQEIEKMPSCVDTVENAHYSMVAIWGQWLLTGVRRIRFAAAPDARRSLAPAAARRGVHTARPSRLGALTPLRSVDGSEGMR